MQTPRDPLPPKQLDFKNRCLLSDLLPSSSFAHIRYLENLQKLQELKYLNLAINNIKRVENLDYCECLEKLDLTANFVDDLLSVASLVPNYKLRDLYVHLLALFIDISIIIPPSI